MMELPETLELHRIKAYNVTEKMDVWLTGTFDVLDYQYGLPDRPGMAWFDIKDNFGCTYTVDVDEVYPEPDYEETYGVGWPE